MRNNSKGSVLPVTVIFLGVVSLTSIFSMQSNLLETKILNNIQKKHAVYHSTYGTLEDFYKDYEGTSVAIRTQLDTLMKGELDEDGLPTGNDLVEELDIQIEDSSHILKTAEIKYIGPQASYTSNEYDSLVFEITSRSEFKNSTIASEQVLSFRKLAPKIKNKLPQYKF